MTENQMKKTIPEPQKSKFCPFLPPMPVRQALQAQPTFAFVACQKGNCELWDEKACACCLKAKVTVDMGAKTLSCP